MPRTAYDLISLTLSLSLLYIRSEPFQTQHNPNVSLRPACHSGRRVSLTPALEKRVRQWLAWPATTSPLSQWG